MSRSDRDPGFGLDSEQRLELAMDVVANAELDFRDAAFAYADAETEYRLAKAAAYLAADGTEKAREAVSIVKSEKLLRARNYAKAAVLAAAEHLRDAQASVSARQSLLNAEVRTNRML